VPLDGAEFLAGPGLVEVGRGDGADPLHVEGGSGMRLEGRHDIGLDGADRLQFGRRASHVLHQWTFQLAGSERCLAWPSARFVRSDFWTCHADSQETVPMTGSWKASSTARAETKIPVTAARA